MDEVRDPAEGRYQLPEGTYRELIVKDRTTKFLKEQMRELREDPRSYHLLEGKAGEAWGHHVDETARVKAAADQEVAAGRPIVVLAWQVQVTRYADRWSDAAPSWLTTPATATVRVFADDTCEHASI
jgi:hypothetical protein